MIAIEFFEEIATLRAMASEHDIHREWLRAQLAKKGRGARSELARYLGVKPDAITRMLNDGTKGKEMRRINSTEIAKMESFFGAPAPRFVNSELSRSDRVDYAKKAWDQLATEEERNALLAYALRLRDNQQNP